VRALIDAGHDIEAADNTDQWTVLHYALMTVTAPPNFGVIKLLLERGANPNRADRRGWTPLHYAARTGDREVITCLLAAGADPKLEDEDGITPLHRYLLKPSPKAPGGAARDEDIVRSMLAHGAHSTPMLDSFLQAVAFQNKAEILALLVRPALLR
jgi:hypothetical protein